MILEVVGVIEVEAAVLAVSGGRTRAGLCKSVVRCRRGLNRSLHISAEWPQ